MSKNQPRTIEVAPQASILIESMRDIGYSLETALADIIDNAIAAEATTIRVYADTSSSFLKIGVLDDGFGMTEVELLKAMRPGTRSPLEERSLSDLGRFGLGLKTASFSQCRKLTVVTRRNGKTSASCWDLDYVAQENKWLVQMPESLSAVPWADLIGENGTLVVWENLDRVVDKNDFVRCVDDARSHLELVFHRFLEGWAGSKKIKISLNNQPLEPFDPFHAGHPATETKSPEKIKIGKHVVTVQSFTLPHHQKVSVAEWDRYAGTAGYLKNQGFYVYREKRLIVHGTWFGLARQMELTKLARVRIDIPNGLDAEWKIDVKKASAHPPYQVRERLRRIIEAIGATSKRVYTVRGRKLVSDSKLPVWNRIQNKGEIAYRLNAEHPVFSAFASQLTEELKREFFRVLEFSSATIPVDALFADMGHEPEKIAANDISDELLRHFVSTTYEKLIFDGNSQEDAIEMMSVAGPFRAHWGRTEKILETLTAKASK